MCSTPSSVKPKAVWSRASTARSPWSVRFSAWCASASMCVPEWSLETMTPDALVRASEVAPDSCRRWRRKE